MPLTTRGTRILFFFGVGLGCGCCGMSCLPVRLDSLSPWERVGERAYATPLFFLFKCYVRGILMRTLTIRSSRRPALLQKPADRCRSGKNFPCMLHGPGRASDADCSSDTQ